MLVVGNLASVLLTWRIRCLILDESFVSSPPGTLSFSNQRRSQVEPRGRPRIKKRRIFRRLRSRIGVILGGQSLGSGKHGGWSLTSGRIVKLPSYSRFNCRWESYEQFTAPKRLSLLVSLPTDEKGMPCISGIGPGRGLQVSQATTSNGGWRRKRILYMRRMRLLDPCPRTQIQARDLKTLPKERTDRQSGTWWESWSHKIGRGVERKQEHSLEGKYSKPQTKDGIEVKDDGEPKGSPVPRLFPVTTPWEQTATYLERGVRHERNGFYVILFPGISGVVSLGDASSEIMAIKLHDAPRRPNLYATIRLMQTVQTFKASLKKRVSAQRQGGQVRSFNGRISEDRAYAALGTFSKDAGARQSYQYDVDQPLARADGSEKHYQLFRYEVNQSASFVAGSWTDCAADFSLFRMARPTSSKQFVDATHWTAQLQRMERLLDRLRAWGSLARKPGVSSESLLHELSDDVFFANLVHLLQCYICMLLNTFVHNFLRFHNSLVEHLRRISIVFGEATSSSGPAQPIVRQAAFGDNNWGDESLSFDARAGGIASRNTGSPSVTSSGEDFTSYSDLADYSNTRLSFERGGSNPFEIFQSTPRLNDATFATDYASYQGAYNHPLEPSLGIHGPNAPVPVPLQENYPAQFLSYSASEEQAASTGAYPMQQNKYPPSPIGSPPIGNVFSRQTSLTGSIATNSPAIEDSLSPMGPGTTSRRRGVSIKREGEVPRDDRGRFVCDHIECAADPPTFYRKCEWSKHMDKHERPYRCEEPGCEKLQGFTYSGGLLRHEREVHKKYGGPKKPLMCPFANCKRSAGVGFTRQENLNEHLRRVHKRQEGGGEESVAEEDEVGGLGGRAERKRKRPPRSDPSDRSQTDLSLGSPDRLREEVMDLRTEVNLLRRGQHETREEIRQLAEAVRQSLKR
ncbi:MAG: hypothetical protein M1837_005417 [Sclerophora amabilis]|nr:MAG: hypothetical protein M1837_005417 [Sclerophora amabilis]